MTDSILKHLKAVPGLGINAALVTDLAAAILVACKPGAERTVALRKLLECQDAIFRALEDSRE